MLRVQISNDVSRQPSRVMDGATTLRQALEGAGIDCNGGQYMVNGRQIPADYLDRTFDELGIAEDVRLSRIGFKNNAR